MQHLYSILFLVFCYSLHAADIELIHQINNNSNRWEILNANKHIEFSSSDFLSDTLCLFELEDDTRYFLKVVIEKKTNINDKLIRLRINGADIILILENLEIGEYEYPFNTGAKKSVLKVIGGSNTTISDLPWQVYFSSGNFICGGSIISEKWILTAAHCVFDDAGNKIPVSNMRIKVGATNPYSSSQGKWYNVKSFEVHEDYNDETLREDIAVLELDESINFANAEIIELISNKEVEQGATDEGTMAVVSGWGLINTDPKENPETLQMVEIPIVSNSTAFSVWGALPNSILMAGYKTGTKNTCKGDSGGPLVVDVNGEYKLAGIVSFGNIDCSTYAGYTRVSYYLDWIYEKTKIKPGLFLQTPQGSTDFCKGITETSYHTYSEQAKEYRWTITPDTAGNIISNNENATIQWDTSFFGNVELEAIAILKNNDTTRSSTQININRPLKFIAQTESSDICAGESFYIIIEAEGDNISYEWYKDNILIDKTNVRVFSPKTDYNNQSGIYHCVISSPCGEYTTDTIHLNITKKTTLRDNLKNISTQQNKEVSFSINAQGDDIKYAWYKDNILLQDKNASTLQINQVKATDIGDYYVKVIGTCGTLTSDTAHLFVEGEYDNVRLWPTTVEGTINIALNSKNLINCTIYDTLGKAVLAKKQLNPYSTLDLSKLKKGIYIVIIDSFRHTEEFKIIKQ